MGGSKFKISVLLLLSFSSVPAYAYIDPGTGSLIIQGLIGAIAAAGVVLKLYWYKLKAFFSRESVDTDDPTSDPGSGSDSET